MKSTPPQSLRVTPAPEPEKGAPASAPASEDEAWLDWQARFAATYDEVNYTSPLQASVMRASHKLTERPFPSTTHFGRVLELGAGTGEHFGHVRHSFDEYVVSDVDAAALERARTRISAGANDKVRYLLQRGEQLDFADSSMDRLIAVHVLEHIPQPHLALREWKRVLKPGGTLSILIPTDPGLAWRLGRTLGPRRQAIAAGIAYDYVMAREHVNACNNLIALMRHYFPSPQEHWWPLVVPSMDLNLFFCCHAVIQK